MALQILRITAKNQKTPAVALPGVTVRVYTSGGTLLSSSLTDAGGVAEFLLDDLTPDYLLRFFKAEVGFTNPYSVSLNVGSTTEVEVTGTSLDLPQAVNPNLCRISGNVVDIFGQDAAQFLLYFYRPFPDPAVLLNRIVTREAHRVGVHSVNGWMQFDLIRGSVCDLMMPGWADKMLRAEVPDLGGVLLSDFIFPVPAEVSFPDDAPTASIAVGDSLTLHPYVKLSNGIYLHESQIYDTVLWDAESSDDAVILGEAQSGSGPDATAVFQALTPGTAQLSVIPRDEQFAVRIPPVTPVCAAVSVTVTP